MASEKQPYLRLQNFRAAMRMCSILKQRKELSRENITQRTLHLAQGILRKSEKSVQSTGYRPAEEPASREGAKVALTTTASDRSSGQDIEYLDYEKAPKPAPKLTFKPVNYEKARQPPLPRIDEESPRYPSPTENLSIEVVNPRTVSQGWFGGSYTLYTVVTKQPEVLQVERRFRDLDWMHLHFCEQFKGVSIPPRPNKQLFWTQTSKFIEERRAQMEKYLNMVARNSILRASDAFKIFLSCPMEKLEEEKAKLATVADARGYTGVEDVVDHLVAKFHCKLNSTLIAGTLSDGEMVRSLETQLACLSPPTCALSQQLSQWVDADKTMMEYARNARVPALLQFADILAEHCAIEAEAVKELDRYVMDVREEEMRLGGLAGAISAYQTMSERCLQQDTLIQRKQSKIGLNTDHDTAARYRREVQAEREVLEQLQGELETTKNNLMRDSQHFSISREAHLAETLKLAVDTQKRRWSRNCEFWQEKLKSLTK